MFRKTILAIAAMTALGAAALAPTSASAGWHGKWGHGWGHGHGYGYGYGYGFGGYGVGLYTPTYDYGGCYNVKRVVATPFGPKIKYVTVCN